MSAAFPWSPPLHVRLVPGERLVWQGGPGWRALAVRLFHIRIVALYCGGLMLADMVQARMQHLGAAGALHAAVPGALTAAGALGIFAALAWGAARTTRYTVTTERVVLQFGLALPATLSIPLHRIASVRVRVRRDQVGDVVLQPHRDARLVFYKLWPCVRAWRFGRPEPMMRDMAGAGQVATILVRLVAAAQRVPAPAPVLLQEAGD